jgi:hypothetical protein
LKIREEKINDYVKEIIEIHGCPYKGKISM